MILPQKNSKQNIRFGFTLIELVVVITILAILGTIGFLSVGGYSSRARDSERLWDVAQLSKSLDLSIVTVGQYPSPDNYFSVTYSGGVVWYQGTAGNGVIQKLHTSIAGGGLDSRPTDPLKGTEFTYSSLAFGKAYQIKTEYEGDVVSLSSVIASDAYAAPGSPTIAYIRWNYGGITAKTVTGSTTYVLAVPSIVTGTWIVAGGSVEIIGNSLSGTLLFNGKNLSGASSYNPNVVVFSGATLPKDDSSGQITAIMQSLKTAYSGSDIAATSAVSTLLNTATGSLGVLGSNILTNQLGNAPSNGGNGGSFTVNGNCVSLPSNATYYGSVTTYTLANAADGTSLSANYSASPSANTCQFSCNGNYSWNGSSCVSSCPSGAVCGANSVEFKTGGSFTWTVGAGVSNVNIYLIGAGGGGGGCTSHVSSNKAGGGGGAYLSRSMAVTSWTNYNITVGAGGTQNVGGGNTVFGSSLSVAGGGAAGNYNSTASNGGTCSGTYSSCYNGGDGGYINDNGGAGGGCSGSQSGPGTAGMDKGWANAGGQGLASCTTAGGTVGGKSWYTRAADTDAVSPVNPLNGGGGGGSTYGNQAAGNGAFPGGGGAAVGDYCPAGGLSGRGGDGYVKITW